MLQVPKPRRRTGFSHWSPQGKITKTNFAKSFECRNLGFEESTSYPPNTPKRSCTTQLEARRISYSQGV
jgi:hypothetical protein